MSKTHWHCWYKRLVKGEENKIQILRVKCCGCKKTHAVLPDFLSPYKHYPLTIQEKVIEQVICDEVSVDHVKIPANHEADRPLLWSITDVMRQWISNYRKRER